MNYLMDYKQIESQRGATYKNGEMVTFKNGYQVCTKHSAEVISESILVVLHIAEQLGLMDFGMWFDDDSKKWVMDTESKHIEDYQEAIEFGLYSGQKAIFDWARFEEIRLRK